MEVGGRVHARGEELRSSGGKARRSSRGGSVPARGRRTSSSISSMSTVSSGSSTRRRTTGGGSFSPYSPMMFSSSSSSTCSTGDRARAGSVDSGRRQSEPAKPVHIDVLTTPGLSGTKSFGALSARKPLKWDTPPLPSKDGPTLEECLVIPGDTKVFFNNAAPRGSGGDGGEGAGDCRDGVDLSGVVDEQVASSNGCSGDEADAVSPTEGLEIDDVTTVPVFSWPESPPRSKDWSRTGEPRSFVDDPGEDRPRSISLHSDDGVACPEAPGNQAWHSPVRRPKLLHVEPARIQPSSGGRHQHVGNDHSNNKIFPAQDLGPSGVHDEVESEDDDIAGERFTPGFTEPERPLSGGMMEGFDRVAQISDSESVDSAGRWECSDSESEKGEVSYTLEDQTPAANTAVVEEVGTVGGRGDRGADTEAGSQSLTPLLQEYRALSPGARGSAELAVDIARIRQISSRYGYGVPAERGEECGAVASDGVLKQEGLETSTIEVDPSGPSSAREEHAENGAEEAPLAVVDEAPSAEHFPKSVSSSTHLSSFVPSSASKTDAGDTAEEASLAVKEARVAVVNEAPSVTEYQAETYPSTTDAGPSGPSSASEEDVGECVEKAPVVTEDVARSATDLPAEGCSSSTYIDSSGPSGISEKNAGETVEKVPVTVEDAAPSATENPAGSNLSSTYSDRAEKAPFAVEDIAHNTTDVTIEGCSWSAHVGSCEPSSASEKDARDTVGKVPFAVEDAAPSATDIAVEPCPSSTDASSCGPFGVSDKHLGGTVEKVPVPVEDAAPSATENHVEDNPLSTYSGPSSLSSAGDTIDATETVGEAVSCVTENHAGTCSSPTAVVSSGPSNASEKDAEDIVEKALIAVEDAPPIAIHVPAEIYSSSSSVSSSGPSTASEKDAGNIMEKAPGAVEDTALSVTESLVESRSSRTEAASSEPSSGSEEDAGKTAEKVPVAEEDAAPSATENPAGTCSSPTVVVSSGSSSATEKDLGDRVDTALVAVEHSLPSATDIPAQNCFSSTDLWSSGPSSASEKDVIDIVEEAAVAVEDTAPSADVDSSRPSSASEKDAGEIVEEVPVVVDAAPSISDGPAESCSDGASHHETDSKELLLAKSREERVGRALPDDGVVGTDVDPLQPSGTGEKVAGNSDEEASFAVEDGVPETTEYITGRCSKSVTPQEDSGDNMDATSSSSEEEIVDSLGPSDESEPPPSYNELFSMAFEGTSTHSQDQLAQDASDNETIGVTAAGEEEGLSTNGCDVVTADEFDKNYGVVSGDQAEETATGISSPVGADRPKELDDKAAGTCVEDSVISHKRDPVESEGSSSNVMDVLASGEESIASRVGGQFEKHQTSTPPNANGLVAVVSEVDMDEAASTHASDGDMENVVDDSSSGVLDAVMGIPAADTEVDGGADVPSDKADSDEGVLVECGGIATCDAVSMIKVDGVANLHNEADNNIEAPVTHGDAARSPDASGNLEGVHAPSVTVEKEKPASPVRAVEPERVEAARRWWEENAAMSSPVETNQEEDDLYAILESARGTVFRASSRSDITGNEIASAGACSDDATGLGMPSDGCDPVETRSTGGSVKADADTQNGQEKTSGGEGTRKRDEYALAPSHAAALPSPGGLVEEGDGGVATSVRYGKEEVQVGGDAMPPGKKAGRKLRASGGGCCVVM